MSSTAIRTRISLVAAAAVVVSLGFSASPANAAVGSMKAELCVGGCQGQSHPYGTALVGIRGLVPMARAEAQDLIDRGHKVVFRMWGDDPLSDDLLYGPRGISIWASEEGLKFNYLSWRVNSAFDEDDSRFDEHDELYAGVRLVTSVSYDAQHRLTHGATVRSAETNRVGGYF